MLRFLSEAALLPPGSILLLLVLGTVLRRFRPRGGRAVQVLAVVLLALVSMPVTGSLLLFALQTDAPLPATGPLPAADAIVVLSAEADETGIEYGRPVAGAMTLRRVRYGAFLQRRSGLPLLMSGGSPGTGLPSLASMMADAARDEFGVPVRWLEERSADTWTNAAHSAGLLRQAGAKRVLLVTSAWHMPRAAASFRAHGLEVVAAPTGFCRPPVTSWTSFVPQWDGQRDTCFALHEWCGAIACWFRS